MFLDFEKWQACKNDFVIFWMNQSQYKNLGESIRRLSPQICDRHSGVGADGVILLVHPNIERKPDFALILNSDGSLAKTCGNGIRCAALSVYKDLQKKSNLLPESLELKVEDLSYTCQFLSQEKEKPMVQVHMGPSHYGEHNKWHAQALSFVKEKLKEKKLEGFFPLVHTVSLANHHLVFILEEELNLDLMRSLGKALQDSPHWDGINVSFASPLSAKKTDFPLVMRSLECSEPYKVFIWERGAGETQACGSAACAVGTCLLQSEWTSRSAWVPTLFPGGWLFSKQQTPEEDIQLCGIAEFVFSGTLSL